MDLFSTADDGDSAAYRYHENTRMFWILRKWTFISGRALKRQSSCTYSLFGTLWWTFISTYYHALVMERHHLRYFVLLSVFHFLVSSFMSYSVWFTPPLFHPHLCKSPGNEGGNPRSTYWDVDMPRRGVTSIVTGARALTVKVHLWFYCCLHYRLFSRCSTQPTLRRKAEG